MQLAHTRTLELIGEYDRQKLNEMVRVLELEHFHAALLHWLRVHQEIVEQKHHSLSFDLVVLVLHKDRVSIGVEDMWLLHTLGTSAEAKVLYLGEPDS
jgi:hypothetical protein